MNLIEKVLFNDAPIGILVVDENTNIVKANEYLFELFDCLPDSYQGKKFGNVFGCAYVSQDGSICGTTEKCSNCDLRNGVLYVLREDVKIKDTVVEHEFLLHDKIVVKELKISAFPSMDANQKYVVITLVDITETKSLETLLQEHENRYKLLFDNMSQGFALHEIILDAKGDPIDYRFLDINSAFETLTGLKKEDLIGKTVLEVLPNTEQYWIDTYGKVALTGKSRSLENYSIELDKYFDVQAFCPKIGQFAAIITDITSRVNLENKLKYSYYHDQMTELYNRQYVFDNFESIDNENNLPLSIISADINGLRSINESYGFVVGDEIIKKVAEAIKTLSGNIYTPVRWGGDDFLILLPNVNSNAVNTIIKELGCLVKKNLTDALSNISVAIGSYTKDDINISLKEAVKQADENMIHNKISDNNSIQNAPINMILHTLHEKNKREQMHSKRVSEICVAIGQAIEMSDEDINKLRMIGLVHDIGKIGIDERILNKPNKLTNRECEIMKQHSEVGFRILSANKQTSELAFYVLSHHERLDGTGYPNGIKADNISMFTRILSIADAFDAMTRERTYCNGISTEDAVQELKRCSGTQFDAKIVDVFANKVLINNPDFSGGVKLSNIYNIIK